MERLTLLLYWLPVVGLVAATTVGEPYMRRLERTHWMGIYIMFQVLCSLLILGAVLTSAREFLIG